MDRSRSALPRIVLGLALVLGLPGPFAARAVAQPGVIRVQAAAAVVKSKDEDSGEPSEATFPAPDRAIVQQMTRARQALKEGRYGEAVEGLDKILKCPEDYLFQPDRKKPIYRSLKAEARQLIGQMPREGRDLYELRCGAEARDMFGRGFVDGDSARLAEVSGQYFHTRAGYEATFLSGLYHLDHGSPLAGALTLRRLREAPDAGDRFEPALSLAMAACWLQAGMPDDAQRTLVALKERQPKAALLVGGRQVPWFEQPSDAVAWLGRLGGPPRSATLPEADRWAMYRGDPARNASTIGSAPLLNMRWRIPVTDDPVLEDILGQFQQTYRKQGVPLVCCLHPLAVGDVVLMRDAWYLWAVDFQTGKRLWTTRPLDDDPWQPLGGRANAETIMRQQQAQWGMMLGQRVWDDATYGTLSSDGRLVFSIEDLGVGLGANAGQMGIVFGRQSDTGPSPCNRLAAHNIRTGKVEWELGGAPGPMALPLAETFFLGPPLPLRGQLFVLAEAKGEISLLALDPNSKGKLLWSQQLRTVERNVTQDPMRRLAGVSPSYADGMLICPTGAGAVVAVDLASHSLLWGYPYPYVGGDNSSPLRQQQLMAMRFGAYYDGVSPMQRWLDGTATVVDGRVLVTPADSDGLHCLKLIDGQPAWKALPRGQEDLYVACVHKGTAVVVGRHSLRGVQLADGKPAWEGRTVQFPGGATVTGRGFYSGNQYQVPLSSAEVLAVDLEAGKTVHVAKARKGSVPGNLVCYKGKVISQGLDAVDTFYQVDAAREEIRQRLAAKPDDAEALSLRGEMLLDEGKSAEAVASFQRAYELDADPRTRELLRDSLLEGLRSDFAAHRKHSAEIEKLLDDSAQRATYLRLMAVGLQQTGEWRAALEQYLRLADLDQTERPLEPVDRSLMTRRDRWIQARLAVLRRAAGAEAGAEIDKIVEARYKSAMEAQGVDSLRRFLDYFGNQPIAPRAQQELIKRLAAGGRLLEVELLLWPDRYGSDRAAAGAALAELAGLFAQAGKSDAAAVCYRELAEHYGDVACRDGKTGRQLADALPPDSPLRRVASPPPTWPAGQAEAKKPNRSERQPYYGRVSVAFHGSPGLFFDNTTVRYSQQGRPAILISDELGKEKWTAQLTDASQPANNFGYYNPNMTRAHALGHFLLLSMGNKIVGLDPCGLSGNTSRLLWSQDLTDASADSGRGPRIIIQGGRRMVIGGGVVVNALGQQLQFRMNPLGPVNSRYICFQRFRNVVAADTATGESLWVRQDIPENSEVFGDEQYVFVLPPDQKEAMVLRAEDGELLGKRSVTRPKSRPNYGGDGMERSLYSSFNLTGMAVLGRCLLSWDQEESEAVSAGLPAAGSPAGAKPAVPRPDRPAQAVPAPAGATRAVSSGQREGGPRLLKLFDPWEQKELWPARKFAAGAKACLVGEEAVGVFEPDGHFVLVELPGGRTIADVKLLPEESIAEIFVTRLGQQYFLLTHDPKPRPGVQRVVQPQPLPGMLSQPVRRGRLYALDLQGKPVWPAPVTVEDQYFLLNQPAGVPVLTFACIKYKQQRLNGGMTVETALACVDRRTGRIVFNDSFPNQHTQSIDIIGRPEQKSVSLQMQLGTVVLNFTEKPLPPPRPGGETTFRPGQGRVSDVLLQIAEDRVGGSLETLGQAAERISSRLEARLGGAPVPERPQVRPVAPRRLR